MKDDLPAESMYFDYYVHFGALYAAKVDINISRVDYEDH